ncbi:hypothetical protein HN903_02040 [archaeon]|jgi:hypothetical protein|nr:hypothetical protein [archaeon]MBT7128513.1 hypothetical protein [archaeon]
MNQTEEVNKIIEEELKRLGKEPKFLERLEVKSISEMETYANVLWHSYVQISSLEYQYPEQIEIIKEKSLGLLNKYAEINQKIGELLLKLKPESFKQNNYFKDMAAQKFIIAAGKLFDFLQSKEIKSDCLVEEKDGIKSFCSTKSAYHKVRELLNKAESIYEDLAVYYTSKNNYNMAHIYYYLVGELLIKEIAYGKKINDWMMYDDFEFGNIFYWAGLAFMKCYTSLKDKYILTSHGPPSVSFINSAISEVFSLGNRGLMPEQLAIKSFEAAKPFLLKSGEKIIYAKIQDYLYELKSELNDFEKNVIELFIKISREFLKKENIVIRKTAGRLQEEDVRDYFLSCLNVVIEEIAVAESLKCRGETDLILFGKDNFRNNLEGISEFKVWPRNKYKEIIKQIKSYLTDFESFGIIVMINEGESSINEKYKKEIIDKDELIVPNSFEKLNFGGTGFEYFKTKSFLDKSKTKEISIYHIILNIFSSIKKDNP